MLHDDTQEREVREALRFAYRVLTVFCALWLCLVTLGLGAWLGSRPQPSPSRPRPVQVISHVMRPDDRLVLLAERCGVRDEDDLVRWYRAMARVNNWAKPAGARRAPVPLLRAGSELKLVVLNTDGRL